VLTEGKPSRKMQQWAKIPSVLERHKKNKNHWKDGYWESN